MNNDYKYDIAFSFCQEDESLAYEISDYLSENLNIFIYSNRQDELVGTDGEIEFKKTFSEKSRVVIVLYREKYGTTTWTRIEEEAIRDRAYDEGYDFTLYIPLDENKATPKYLPRTRIWLDLERFGTKGAANIISYIVNERGGDSRQISSKDKAEKIKRKLEFKRKLEVYKETAEALEDALREIDLLIQTCEEKSKEIFNGLQYIHERQHQEFFKISYENLLLQFWWTRSYSNSLDKSKLEVTIWKFLKQENPLERPRPYNLKSVEYYFEKNLGWENIWRIKNGKTDNEYFKTNFLIEKHFTEFLTIIENEKIDGKNNGPISIWV